MKNDKQEKKNTGDLQINLLVRTSRRALPLGLGTQLSLGVSPRAAAAGIGNVMAMSHKMYKVNLMTMRRFLRAHLEPLRRLHHLNIRAMSHKIHWHFAAHATLVRRLKLVRLRLHTVPIILTSLVGDPQPMWLHLNATKMNLFIVPSDKGYEPQGWK